MSAPAIATEQRYYLVADKRATYPLRFKLGKMGLKWDKDTRVWYALDAATRSAAVQLLGANEWEQPEPTQASAATAAATPSWLPAAVHAAQEHEQEQQQQPLPTTDAGEQLAALVRQLAAGTMDENRVKQIVRESFDGAADEMRATLADALQELRNREPTRLVVDLSSNGEQLSTRELPATRHGATDDVLAAIAAGMRNVLLVGPAGSGKTTLAHTVADALGLPFASISCSAGMSEGQLLGRLLPTGDAGRFEYSTAPLVNLYETGGVFLLDEVDAADANTLLVLNSALANGHLDVPNRLAQPTAQRHERFILIAAANTWGTGADRQYVGRNQLDAAFLSRFAGSVVEMGYDSALEQAIAGQDGAPLLATFLYTRGQLAANSVRRVWGTRELVAAVRWLRAGKSERDALRKLTVGWTADELRKGGL